MKEEDKIRLKANHKYLVKHILYDEIRDHLYEKGVLSDEEIEDLDAERTPTRAARRLLLILPRKDDNAFGHLIVALKEANGEHISTVLECTCVNDFKESDYVDALHGEDKIKQLQSQMFLQTELFMVAKKEIDYLRERVEKNEEESSKLKAKYSDLEKTMADTGLKEGHVVEILKDYLSNTDVPDMQLNHFSSPAPSPKHFNTNKPQHSNQSSDMFSFSDEDVQKQSGQTCSVIAREMGRDIVKYVVQKTLKGKISEPKSPYCETMRRLVDELFAKWQELFDNFITRLNMDQISGYETFIHVADEIFKEGENNWGRIVVLYAFAAYVARHCVENDLEKITQFMGDFLGYYVVKRLGPWIKEKGGWAIFLKKFSPPLYNPYCIKWKRVLWTAVSLAGIGALAGMAAAKH